jgi:NAD(P)-dependent dehydrogenase (short-subunit alcohol dehydrogenase family)/glycosyltransferase involved in cell wall biosynthesis
MDKKKISVVTSAYNEEAGIRACVDEVRRVMTSLADTYDYEHVIADNCSLDGTLNVLRDIAKEDPHVKVIANSRNFGAEKSAFNAIKYTTGDAVVGITADMQEPPSLIPKMAELWASGYDVVYGIYKNPHEGLIIRTIRKLYYWLVDKLSTESLPKDFMGFALMDRRVVDEVISVDDYAPYIRGIIATVGFKQIGIRYERGVRKTGDSKHGLAFLFDFGLNGLISHSIVPIRAATTLGFFLFFLSILAIIVVIVLRFVRPGLQAPGITTLVTVVTFFSGVQLLFLGMLGEYIGAIHSQTRRKPFVIVKETLNVAPEVLARRARGETRMAGAAKTSEPAALPARTPEAPSAPQAQPQTAAGGRALVFGGKGALGASIAAALGQRNYAVSHATRTKTEGGAGAGVVWVDPEADGGLDALAGLEPLSAVVWAQGANVNDDPKSLKDADYRGVMAANVDYVVQTLHLLLEKNLLAPNAALCVVSSIWQDQARPGKFSYTISKAAVGGLVRAAALDLAARGVRINAVLPGVVDTPMTRAMLSPEQRKKVEGMTPLGRLVTAEEVASVVSMLVGPESSALTGQSIVVDGGFSVSRAI